VWNGYIDGAISSGLRAADEVVSALSSQAEG
jgi:monoamine oxidase